MQKDKYQARQGSVPKSSPSGEESWVKPPQATFPSEKDPDFLDGAASDPGTDDAQFPASTVCAGGQKRNCPRNVMDGDTNTVWHCSMKTPPCVLRFDRGKTASHKVRGLALLTLGERVTSGLLQYSQDGGKTWVEALPKSELVLPSPSPTSLSKFFLPIPISARFWRLEVYQKKPSVGWPVLKELAFLTEAGKTGSAVPPGGVTETVDTTPEIWTDGKWMPICGHWFWDSQEGARTFCRALGFDQGECGSHLT